MNESQKRQLNKFQATLKASQDNARHLGGDKEQTDSRTLVVCVDGEIAEAVKLRCWMGRSRSASVVHASVWFRAPDGDSYRTGRGQAGGHGYCKHSAASEAALDAAGVYIMTRPEDGEEPRFADIGGAGMDAVEAGLLAAAVAMGWDLENNPWGFVQ